MRQDNAAFAAANEAKTKEPKFVVAIVFDVASIYLTSHAGITSVPGTVLANMLQDTSSISQRIVPDQARSEIGSMSFKVVDVGGAFTTEVKNKLGAGKGLKGKTVKLYVGHGPMDFSQFQLFQTQVITSASADDGLYQIDCEDISRIQRAQIFDLAKTTLRLPVGATDTSIPVYTTTGFVRVLHNSSWSDAPSSTVRYIKIGDEIIRSTGETADTFTGCTRGVHNTRAVAHDLDAATTADRRPKVEEYVYLELPAAKLIYALMTGVLYNDSANLPATWHLGIDTGFVRLADFTGIGADLWDPANDSNGFPVRFEGLAKTDGKKFIEEELLQLLGCYAPIYSDGTQGIRRLSRVLADAAPVAVITDQHAMSWGQLRHSMARLHNYFQVDWNWNGKEYTRRSIFVDAASVAIHGKAPILAIKFKGLHGSKHTDAMISTRLGFMRDRFAGPPQEIDVDVLPSLSKYEVGDVIRLQLPNVRDYAGNTGTLDRAFEIQNKQEKAQDGEVRWELFASTAKASVDPASAASTALPDAYYTAAGVALSTVATIVGNVVQPGTWDLPGNDDLNNAGAIYYHNADLTIGSTATLRLTKNIQLRIKGFLTINGTIQGSGRGSAGIADVGTFGSQAPGTLGYIGSSRGRDGVDLTVHGSLAAKTFTSVQTRRAGAVASLLSAFPLLDLKVSGNNLLGLPTNLQGCSGGPGGKVVDSTLTSVLANGGTGANAGAGLAIICRGMAFGVTGQIALSGASPAATSTVVLDGNFNAYPGPGGAGTPGGLFIGLDGAGLSVPDLTAKFFAVVGTVPNNGYPLSRPDSHSAFIDVAFVLQPWDLAGYPDPGVISGLDLSNSAHRIQYIPETQTAAPDAPLKPSAPTGVQAASGIGQNVVIWTAATDDAPWDDKVAEIYASITNNLPDAVYVGEIAGTRFVRRLINHETEWYWVRYRARISNTTVFSDFSPIGPTSTATATAERPDDYASAVSAENLFYNGNAEFGDNRNWTGKLDPPFGTGTGPLTWNASGGYNTGPYFSYTGNPGATLFSDGRAIINLDHEYELIGAFRGGSTSDNATYMGFASIDAIGANIEYGRCWRYPVATYSTTLAANANLGATSIDVNLPANHWDTIGGNVGIHFNVDNDDDGSDLPTLAAKYVYVNNITKSNLGGGVWRYTFSQGSVPGNFTTGQRVNVSVDSSTFSYALVAGETPTANWQRRGARLRGVNSPTSPPGTFVENGLTYWQFRRGTVYSKPIILHAYGAAAARTTHYDEFTLYDIGPKGTALPPDADNTFKQRLIPDAEFDNVDPTNYWEVAPLIGGTSTITFSPTGGIFGGRALLHFGTNTVELRPLARTKFQPVGEPNVGVYIRMRRTASLAADLFMDVCAQRYDAVGSWANNSGYTLTLNNTTLPVANTWYEFYVPRKFFSAGAATYPFETVTLRIIGSGSASGDIEIDAFQATVMGADFIAPTASGGGFQGQVPAPATNATPGSAVLADDVTFKQMSSFAIASAQLTGTLPDARVAQSNVTQHQAALAIAASQVSGVMKQGLVTIPVLAAAMQPATTNGAAAGVVETATNKVLYKTLDFDQTTQEFAGFAIPMPKSWNDGTITFQPIWTFASSSGGVVWALQAVACSDGDAGDVAYGTEQTSTDTALTAGQVHIGPTSAAITIAGTPATNDLIFFRVKRNPADGSDTLAADARLLGIRIFFTQNLADDT